MSRLVIVAFFSILVTPFIGMLLGINSQTDNTEYRRLLRSPVLNDTPINIIPKNITDYFNDNFGFRNLFIKLYGEIKLNILNTHPLYANIIGTNGWIFMNPVVFPSINEWHQQSRFNDSQLRNIATYLQSEKDWLEVRDIPYILVIVPYKEHVYKEKYPYPDHIVTKPLLEQFLSYMSKNTDLEVIDLRDPLIIAKEMYPVYYRTDSHWNQWGAFIGYQEIGKRIVQKNNGFHLYAEDEFDIKPEFYQRWVGDLMRTSATWKNRVPDVGVKLTLKSEYLDRYPKLNSIFVYGDSFAETRHYANREDFLENFPELRNHLDLIFAPPYDAESLRIKVQIDDLIPIIQRNIADEKLTKRLERYLINFRLQDDEILGINYFLGFNFESIHFKQRQDPLEKELIENNHPSAVVREIIEQVLYPTLDEFSKTSF